METDEDLSTSHANRRELIASLKRKRDVLAYLKPNLLGLQKQEG